MGKILTYREIRVFQYPYFAVGQYFTKSLSFNKKKKKKKGRGGGGEIKQKKKSCRKEVGLTNCTQPEWHLGSHFILQF